ncbi:MAG: phosphonate ABC transporter ATP-binding protein [Oscillospiraceae bacterium]|nr:phosphonate ABC transporter ATP-binding protein [Oscillospiraceae bacterium]
MDATNGFVGEDTLLSIKNLKKDYGPTKAVDDVTFDIKSKEIVTIIGRSGAGKSTIMRCVNRLVQTDGGNIKFGGVDIRNKMEGKVLRGARCKIGFIFQHFNLVYRLTVFQNVMHGRLGHMSAVNSVLGRYSEEDKEKAFQILHSLGLEDQIYKRAGDLSGGQKQRVGIARALIQEPSLLMCDEPIASLDPVTSRTIMDIIVSQAKQRGIACLINLHQVDFAKEYSTRILGMKAGKLVFDDSPDLLTEEKIKEIYGSAPETNDKYILAEAEMEGLKRAVS